MVKCPNHQSSTVNKYLQIHEQTITRHKVISFTWGSRNSPFLLYKNKKTKNTIKDKIKVKEKKLETQRRLYRWPGLILQYSFKPFPNNATSIIFPIGANAKEWPSITTMLKIRSASNPNVSHPMIISCKFGTHWPEMMKDKIVEPEICRVCHDFIESALKAQISITNDKRKVRTIARLALRN
jgi:hypothetical protein